jgi:hypothetical protein
MVVDEDDGNDDDDVDDDVVDDDVDGEVERYDLKKSILLDHTSLGIVD